MSVDLSIVDDACAEAFGEDVTIPALSATPITVIVRRGTRRDLFGAGAREYAAPAWVVEVRKSVWPGAARDADVVLVDGSFKVDDVGQDDAGMTWLLDLRKT